MRLREARAPLIIAGLGLIAGFALATTALPVGVRALGAIALAFALPGSALATALLPRGTSRWTERVTVAVGGSLSAAVASAFALQVLPGGLSAASWATLLGGVTVVGGLVGWLRLRGRPTPVVTPDAVGATPWVAGPPPSFTGAGLVTPWTVVTLAAAAVLVALSLVIARSGVALGPTARFTELWLLPADGGSAVHVGVGNHEGAAQTYRVVVTFDGRPLDAPRRITLADGAATDTVIELPVGAGGAHTVEARLWRPGRPLTDLPDRAVRTLIVEGAR